MTLIDKRGERPVCDRCHRVRVKIKRGGICVECAAARSAERIEEEAIRHAIMQSVREAQAKCR